MKALVALAMAIGPLVVHAATLDFTGYTSSGVGADAGTAEAVYGKLTFDIDRANPAQSQGSFGTASQWSALSQAGVYTGGPGPAVVPLMFSEKVYSQATGQLLYATGPIAGASGDSSFIGAGAGNFFGASESVARNNGSSTASFQIYSVPGTSVFTSNSIPETFNASSPNAPLNQGGSAVSYVSITSGDQMSGFEVHIESLLASAASMWSGPATGGPGSGGGFVAPEIDPGSATAALTLLLGGLAVLRSRWDSMRD